MLYSDVSSQRYDRPLISSLIFSARINVSDGFCLKLGFDFIPELTDAEEILGDIVQPNDPVLGHERTVRFEISTDALVCMVSVNIREIFLFIAEEFRNMFDGFLYVRLIITNSICASSLKYLNTRLFRTLLTSMLII